MACARLVAVEVSPPAAPPPSLPTLHRAIQRDLTPGERAGLAGGERAARKHDVFLARPRPWRNKVWETDHVQAPVLVEVDGKPRRPWITWFTDCATNAITGVAVTPGHPSRESVLAARRSAVLREDPYGPAAETLARSLEDGSDRLRGLYGSLCLHVALSAAQERREGDAWHWWDRADRAAARLGGTYMHPWTAFGRGNTSVHGVSIAADLGAHGTALQRMSEVDPETIPSIERRSRLYLDAARGERARHQIAAALTYLRLAVTTSPEAVRYTPAGRALAEDLARTAPAPLRRAAHDVASLVGVPAA